MITLYASSDVALALDVTNSAVTNYRKRFPDSVPEPFAESLGGIPYWDEEGLRAWVEWSKNRHRKAYPSANEGSRRAAIEAALGRQS